MTPTRRVKRKSSSSNCHAAITRKRRVTGKRVSVSAKKIKKSKTQKRKRVNQHGKGIFPYSCHCSPLPSVRPFPVRKMNSTANYTADFLSWTPPLTSHRHDNAALALTFLAFAMISAFLFALVMSKFQRQLRQHLRSSNTNDQNL